MDAHTLTRTLTASHFSDTIWSVLTGPDVETALKIGRYSESLFIKSVLSNTKINLDKFEEGWMYSEIEENYSEVKEHQQN